MGQPLLVEFELDAARLNRAMYDPTAMAMDALLGPIVGRVLHLWQAYAVATVYRSAISAQVAPSVRNAVGGRGTIRTGPTEEFVDDLRVNSFTKPRLPRGPVAAEEAGVRIVDPAELRWSQTTAGGRGRAAPIRQSMAEKGWAGDPIDVVQTADGLVTVDHTRAAIALQQGIRNIPVRVHSPSEPLPADMLTRPWNRAGDTATTWGEAVRIRGAGQTPPIGPTGSPYAATAPTTPVTCTRTMSLFLFRFGYCTPAQWPPTTRTVGMTNALERSS
jgi:hypothetical protein